MIAWAGLFAVADPTGRLEWALRWSWAPRLAVIVLALGILGLAWLNLRQLSVPRRRYTLLGLRALLLVSLLLVLLQPTWVSQSPRTVARRVAVVVDRSLSMARGANGERRWERARVAAKQLTTGHSVSLFTLADDLQPVTGMEALARTNPDGAATDFLAALAELGERRRLTDLAAVVLISDGLDTGRLRARNPAVESPLDEESNALVEHLGVPIHSVFVGDPKPARDLAVSAIRASSFAFTRTFMPVAVDVEISGYAERSDSLALVLSDNGKPVVTRQVPLAGPGRRTIDLEFQPLHVGPHVLEASIVPLPDELTETNNRTWAGLRVVRDRVRVLHLAGHPSWDSRFLRTHLRGNPAVDLVSFYVMVGQGSGAYVSADDTTLIPFPTREIFEESLSSFDLLIFQDFPFGPFQIDQYLPQLRNYVTGGGAFLVLGGRQALSGGGYYGTGLADWLPLRLQPLTGDDVGYLDGPLPLRLTPAGETHPVARLAGDPEANREAWGRNAFQGRNTALLPGETGLVLVTDAAGHPLVAVGEAGSGRSAVVATDSLWTWAFPATAAETTRDRSRTEYHRLLDQLMAWLLRDPEVDALRVDAPGDPVPFGTPVRLQVTAVGAAGEPLAGVTVQVAVEPMAQVPGPAVPRQPWPEPTDLRGAVTLQISDLTPGPHRLVVEALIGGRVEQATAPLVVLPPSGEASLIQPSDALLRSLAKASGGQVWQARAPAEGVPMGLRDGLDFADGVYTDLWSRPEVLLWLVALMGLEWALRRRWGLA